MEDFYKNLFKVMSASEVGNAHSECRRSKIFRVKTKGYLGIFQQKLSQIPLQYHLLSSKQQNLFEFGACFYLNKSFLKFSTKQKKQVSCLLFYNSFCSNLPF